MENLTAGEVSRIQEQLEAEAATLLGRFLFSFSRLDHNVGLLVASAERVQGRAQEADQVANFNFHKRLDYLAGHIQQSTSMPTVAKDAYSDWLQAAHVARSRRNELVHGRWGVEPYKGKVLNIVGLASSNEQRAVEYSIDELRHIISELDKLQQQLYQLGKRWPI